MLVGGDCNVDQTSRVAAKSPFDGQIPINFDILESLFDSIFCKLGIDTTAVEHPIVLTEPIASPNYSRRLTSELMFECYGVPSLTYGIDALFSAHQNGKRDAIVVSSGHHATHVLPVLDGAGVLEQSKRLNYGGSQATEFMLKSMQLKYPSFPTKMSPQQAQELVHEHTYVADDFGEEMSALQDPSKLAQIDRLIQFPYVKPVVEEKSEEDIARLAERRREQAMKLQEIAAKNRLEKLIQREQELEYYTQLKANKPNMKKSEWISRLESEGFQDESEFEGVYKKTEEAIQRARRKQLGTEAEESTNEPPNLPMVNIPDDKLNEFELKEKRKQRLILAGWEARQRAKKEKEAEKARLDEIARLEQERRINDPEGWIADLRQQREDVVNKIKERKLRKAQLSDRRSHASQMRMKSIAALASDTPTKKRRRGGDDDTFGADDSDWAVYREIKGDDESEDEDEINAQLNNLEAQLLEHDELFTEHSTYEAQTSHRHTIMYRLTHGAEASFDSNDFAQLYQLHVNVERMRVPEVLFQPSIAGIDQAGLVELISDMLKKFEVDQRKRLLSNVFLTGGHTRYPNLAQRLQSNLFSVVPVESGYPDLRVSEAKDAALDAWRGAAKWARQDKTFSSNLMTRQEWEECGHEWLKEHRFANRYYPLSRE